MKDKELEAVRISIKFERIDGTYGQLENWFVPDVVAQEFMLNLVSWEDRWHGSFKEVQEFIVSKEETTRYFNNKEKNHENK